MPLTACRYMAQELEGGVQTPPDPARVKAGLTRAVGTGALSRSDLEQDAESVPDPGGLEAARKLMSTGSYHPRGAQADRMWVGC